MKKLKILSLLLLIALALTSCKNTEPVKDKMLTVSIPPQEYFVKKIAGDLWKVYVLVQPGVGPETFDPSPRDMEQVSRSRLFLMTNYLDFEKQLATRLEGLKDGPKLVNTAEGIVPIEGSEHAGHAHGLGADPHIWISPIEVMTQAKNICRALCQEDPDNQKVYEQRLDDFLQELRVLITQIEKDFTGLKTRKFLIFHPAFGYLARDYQLEQLSLEFDGKQPSTQQVSELVKEAREAGIRTIFLQTQYDAHQVESLRQELDGRVVTLDPMAADWMTNLRTMVAQLREAMNGK